LHLILLKVDFLKEKVAVATIDGKSYFFIVNQLREHNIPFVSLVPGDQVASQVKVVVTTEPEKSHIPFEKMLIFTGEEALNDLTNEIKRILLGKEAYEKIIIGIDPGVATGLAVIADGNIIFEENCFNLKEVINSITRTIKKVDFEVTIVCVKIGNGVPIYKDFIEALNEALPSPVILEIVSEAGTNKPLKEYKRSRRVRHISSAKQIAGRSGYIFPRRKILATNNSA
jgi:hypothetical protein